MFAYIAKRLGLSVVTLLITATTAFIVLAILPGDLAYAILGDNATPERLADVRAQLGLDDPLFVRYLNWFAGAVRLDFGTSAISGQSVIDDMVKRMPVTLELAILAQVVAITFAIPAGILSAVFRGRPIDLIIRPLSIIGLAVPSFWLALLVLLLPSRWWNYAPPAYKGLTEDPVANLQLMIPAAVVLGILSAASLSRLVRTSLLEVLRDDYIRTARAKGITEWLVVVKHGLPNSFAPVATALILNFSALLGGTVILEQIFSLPGLGSMAIQAIRARDFPVVQAFVVFMVFVYVTGSVLADIVVAAVDPRVRLD